jgi:hypothetical protein
MAVIQVGPIAPNQVWQDSGGWGHSASPAPGDVADAFDATYAYHPHESVYPGYGFGTNAPYILIFPLGSVPAASNHVITRVDMQFLDTSDHWGDWLAELYWGGDRVAADYMPAGGGYKTLSWVPAQPMPTIGADIRGGWRNYSVPWGPQFVRVNHLRLYVSYDVRGTRSVTIV